MQSQSLLIKTGQAHLQEGDYDAAIGDLLKALEGANPTEKEDLLQALRGLGWSYYHRGEYNEAIRHFNKIQEDNLSDKPVILQDVFRGLGWSYYRKNNFNDAIDNFNLALEHIDSADKEILEEVRYGLGLACEMKRDGGVYDNIFYESKARHISGETAFTKLGPPEIIEIEPTFACNLRCIQCHVSYQKLPNTMIDFKFVKHLKGLKGKWVVLGSNYEPMVHPKFRDIVVALSGLGLKIDLLTNGTLFTEAMSNQLADCNLSNITISFDGIRKKTYESIRRKANYERTIERILYFKNRVTNEKTYFAVNNTLMRRNIDEVVESVDFWEKQGFDHIGFIIMALRDLNEAIKQESLENMMDYIYERLEEAAKRVIENNYRITLSGAGLKDLSELKAIYPANFVGGCVKSNNPQARTPFNPGEFVQNGYYPGMPVQCRSPFKSARILYNGNVELCYQFPIGNIYDNDLLDIWYGEKAQRVREYLMRNSKVCHACEYYNLCIKAGELDYSNVGSFYSELADKKYRYPEVVEELKSYNYKIVNWIGDYYAIPTYYGSVNIVTDNVAELKGVFIDKSIDRLKDTVRDYMSIEAFDERIRTDPKGDYDLRGRGLIHLQKGNYKAAIKDLSEALKCINPAEKRALQETLRGLGWAHFHRRKYEEAIKYFNKVLEDNLSDESIVLQDVFRGLGWAYFRTGEYDEAIKYFNKVLEDNLSDESIVL